MYLRGVTGEINSEIILSFDVGFELADSEDADLSFMDPDQKKPILKSSKTLEKGFFFVFNQEEDNDNIKFEVEFKDAVNTITVCLTKSLTSPLLKISTAIPNPGNYLVSELFLEGYFEITKVSIVPMNKTIKGTDLKEKLKDGKLVKIADKLCMQEIGPPKIKVSAIKTEHGVIEMARVALDVEI